MGGAVKDEATGGAVNAVTTGGAINAIMPQGAQSALLQQGAIKTRGEPSTLSTLLGCRKHYPPQSATLDEGNNNKENFQ